MEPRPQSGEQATRRQAPLISIVVPTFQEAANVELLATRVHEAMAARATEYELILVDDDSRDGIDAAAAQLAARGLPVRLIVRTGERGLATAVLRGFAEARGEVLVCMDGDLSHPPRKILELTDALDRGDADFVLASRYVADGGSDEDWGFLRRLNSRLATWLARPFTAVKDPMSGFFALRRSTLRAGMDLRPIGYKIALELIVRCRCRRIVEVPFCFANRSRGRSKLSLREQINYLRHLGRLAWFKMGM